MEAGGKQLANESADAGTPSRTGRRSMSVEARSRVDVEAPAIACPPALADTAYIILPRPSEGLTGLRFLAAMMVAVPHGLYSLCNYVDSQGRDLFAVTLLSLPTTLLSGLGMSLFFTLSGFVIHFNYGPRLLRLSWRQIHEFIVARFARLYPLYFVALLVELIVGRFMMKIAGDGVPEGFSPAGLPFYATLSQMWFWRDYLGFSLQSQYGETAQVAWSISTEWFFYMVYPLIALVLGRVRSWRSTLFLAIVFAAAATVYAVALIHQEFNSSLQQAAESLKYGPVAAHDNWQDSFARWRIYFSPYSRILEFIGGCFMAQLYLWTQRPGAPRLGRRGAEAATAASVLVVVMLHLAIMMPGSFGLPDWVLWLHMNFGYALGVMPLLYLVATYRTVVERFLSLRWMVVGGNMSYSIYLLHMAFWTMLHRGHIGPALGPTAIMFLRFLVAFALLLFVSYTVYRHFEMPARMWLRRHLSIPAVHGTRIYAARHVVVVVIFIAPIATALSSRVTFSHPYPDTISDVAARYGGSCGVQPFAASAAVATACLGKTACDYTVDARILGDPANGCGKDFLVVWRCASSANGRHRLLLPAEAGLGSVAHLACNNSR